jgi:dihydrofolate reductase
VTTVFAGMAAGLDGFIQSTSGDLSWLDDAMTPGGLIDEPGLAVIPVVLGDGVPFFGTLASSTTLELMECRPFPSGTVLLDYRVVRP